MGGNSANFSDTSNISTWVPKSNANMRAMQQRAMQVTQAAGQQYPNSIHQMKPPAEVSRPSQISAPKEVGVPSEIAGPSVASGPSEISGPKEVGGTIDYKW